MAKLIGVEKPACAAEPLAWVYDTLTDLCEGTIDRVVIHNADAVGMWLYKKYPDAFLPILKHTQITVPFRSVMPSWTPVCFATMYSGALPEVHGIQAYERHPLTIDTLFDSIVKAGKKVAIISTPGTSMSIIFQGKGVDLYICPEEENVAEKAQTLILEDKYDVLCVYAINYDEMDHRHGPEAKESLEALYGEGMIFDKLVSCIKRNWKDHNTLVAFSPDHGVHAVPEGTLDSKGNPLKGTHGTDSPLDLNILHFMGIVPKEE